MSNAMQVFDFKENAIRVVRADDGEPWFHADDVAKVLGYREAFNMTRILDEDETAPHTVRIRSENGVMQDREVTIISESGLYHAILKSRKPEAKTFRRWVTQEVLPSIRKSGYFAVDSDTNTAIKQYLLFLRANKASGLPLTIAVEHSRQAMRSCGVDIDAILPMPSVTTQEYTANDDAERDRIFSIIQSKGSVPQGVIFNRCRNMRKEDIQKHIDVLLLQNKIQQIVLENPTNKKRFNLYRIAVTFCNQVTFQSCQPLLSAA